MAKNLDGDASVVHVIVVVVDVNVDVVADTFFRGVGKPALDLFLFLERDSEDFVSWQKIGPSEKNRLRVESGCFRLVPVSHLKRKQPVKKKLGLVRIAEIIYPFS